MTSQLYDVQINGEKVDIVRNGSVIYSVSVIDKTINLKELYEKMEVNISDELILREGLEMMEIPKNDIDRVYNNTIDFVNRLIVSVNEKLITIRARQVNSIFE